MRFLHKRFTHAMKRYSIFRISNNENTAEDKENYREQQGSKILHIVVQNEILLHIYSLTDPFLTNIIRFGIHNGNWFKKGVSCRLQFV